MSRQAAGSFMVRFARPEADLSAPPPPGNVITVAFSEFGELVAREVSTDTLGAGSTGGVAVQLVTELRGVRGVSGGGADGLSWTLAIPFGRGDGGDCNDIVDRATWMPVPLRYPDLGVSAVSYGGSGYEMVGELPELVVYYDPIAATVDLADASLVISPAAPEINQRGGLDPIVYGAAVSYDPPLAGDEQALAVTVIGPLTTSDTGEGTLGTPAGASIAPRVPVQLALDGVHVIAEALTKDEAWQPTTPSAAFLNFSAGADLVVDQDTLQAMVDDLTAPLAFRLYDLTLLAFSGWGKWELRARHDCGERGGFLPSVYLNRNAPPSMTGGVVSETVVGTLRVEPAKLWLVIQIVESTGLGVDLRSGPVREPESVAVDNVFSTAPGEEFALPAVLPYAYYPERDEFPYHMIQWVVDLDYVRRAELDRLQSLPEDPENPVDPESMRFVMAFTAAHGYFNPDPEHQYPPLTISATVIAGGAVVPGGVPETEYREAGPPFVVTGGVVRAATQVAVPSNNTGTTGLVRVEYDLIGAPEMIVLVEED